jgi:hypothetical protein
MMMMVIKKLKNGDDGGDEMMMMTPLMPGGQVAVGYMDPGNWATDLAGGALYNYNLLFAVLVSSLLAMFLQVGTRAPDGLIGCYLDRHPMLLFRHRRHDYIVKTRPGFFLLLLSSSSSSSSARPFLMTPSLAAAVPGGEAGRGGSA